MIEHQRADLRSTAVEGFLWCVQPLGLFVERMIGRIPYYSTEDDYLNKIRRGTYSKRRLESELITLADKLDRFNNPPSLIDR